MKLNDEEQDILAGKFGPLPQEAIRHQKSVGEFFDATDFVPVTQAHIMADTESLGEAGVCWLERLATTVQGQRRVRIPTITDPRGTDFAKAASLGQTSAMLNLERRAISALPGPAAGSTPAVMRMTLERSIPQLGIAWRRSSINSSTMASLGSLEPFHVRCTVPAKVVALRCGVMK